MLRPAAGNDQGHILQALLEARSRANNLVRDLSGTSPYKPDGPAVGIGILVEADTSVSGNVVEGVHSFGMVYWPRDGR